MASDDYQAKVDTLRGRIDRAWRQLSGPANAHNPITADPDGGAVEQARAKIWDDLQAAIDELRDLDLSTLNHGDANHG